MLLLNLCVFAVWRVQKRIAIFSGVVRLLRQLGLLQSWIYCLLLLLSIHSRICYGLNWWPMMLGISNVQNWWWLLENYGAIEMKFTIKVKLKPDWKWLGQQQIICRNFGRQQSNMDPLPLIWFSLSVTDKKFFKILSGPLLTRVCARLMLMVLFFPHRSWLAVVWSLEISKADCWQHYAEKLELKWGHLKLKQRHMKQVFCWQDIWGWGMECWKEILWLFLCPQAGCPASYFNCSHCGRNSWFESGCWDS